MTIAVPQFAIKTTDEDRTFAGGFNFDAELSIPLLGGKTYEITTVLIFNNGYQYSAEFYGDLLYSGTASRVISEDLGRWIAAPTDEQLSYSGVLYQLTGPFEGTNNLGGGFNAAFRGGNKVRTIIDTTTAGDWQLKWYYNGDDLGAPARLYAGSFMLARPLCV